MIITKDTIIGDILDADFDAAPYFNKYIEN